MTRLINTSILSTLFILSASLPMLAQGSPPATPIDGGLSMLLAEGSIYGIKKLRDNRIY